MLTKPADGRRGCVSYCRIAAATGPHSTRQHSRARLVPSGHHRRRVGPEPWIPLAERRLPFAVQHPGEDLQQQVGPPLAPPHLLLLHHPFTHHVVHRRFHKTRTDPLAVAVALAVVRDEAAIALDRRGKLLYRLAQLPCYGVV